MLYSIKDHCILNTQGNSEVPKFSTFMRAATGWPRLNQHHPHSTARIPLTLARGAAHDSWLAKTTPKLEFRHAATRHALHDHWCSLPPIQQCMAARTHVCVLTASTHAPVTAAGTSTVRPTKYRVPGSPAGTFPATPWWHCEYKPPASAAASARNSTPDVSSRCY